MKKIIYSFLIGFIYIQCSAQTRLTPGEIKGRYETFVVFKIKQFDSVKRVGVYSKSNKYNNGIPYSEAERNQYHAPFIPMNPKKDVHVNNDAVKQIVYSILAKKLDALKQNKEEIDLIFAFEPNGKLVDISFTLHENTVITLPDVENIDRQLRASIKAAFTGKQYLQYVAINYYMPSITF